MKSLATQMMGCKGFSKEQASECRRLWHEAPENDRALNGAAAHALAMCANDRGCLYCGRRSAQLRIKRCGAETRGENGVT
jgi:hypothetical protein